MMLLGGAALWLLARRRPAQTGTGAAAGESYDYLHPGTDWTRGQVADYTVAAGTAITQGPLLPGYHDADGSPLRLHWAPGSIPGPDLD